MKKIISIISVVVIAFTVFSFALVQNWDRIGVASADMTKTEIEVNIRQLDTPYESLKIGVAKAQVSIEQMEIVFEDGSTRMIEVNMDFKSDLDLKQIDLANNDKRMSKVLFTYSALSQNTSTKGVFQIWGE